MNTSVQVLAPAVPGQVSRYPGDARAEKAVGEVPPSTDRAVGDGVRAAQIRALYRQILPVLIGNFAVMGITGLVMWQTANRVTLIGWMIAVTAITATRAFLHIGYRKATPGDDQLAEWGHRFVVLALASGLAWGIGVAVLFVSAPLVEQVLLAAVIVGMMAGAVAANSAYLPAFFAFAGPALLPVAVLSLTAGDQIHLVIGVLLLIYSGLMSLIAANAQSALVEGRLLEIEKDKLLDRLREAHRETKAASNAKSAFLANMSHELRTPLNAINGFSQIMKDQMFGPLGNERYRQYVTLIHDSGDHLLNLIEDILDLSKIESGAIELEETAFDPDSVITRGVEMLQERARRDGVLLYARLATDQSALRADERRLRQIVLNLVSNAVKFTPRGGTVAITAGIDEETGAFILEVADTGIGISPKDMPHILDPFVRGTERPEIGSEGTGLGLPLVKRLVELHGGTLEIDSAPNEGTTVTVRLPARRVVVDERRKIA